MDLKVAILSKIGYNNTIFYIRSLKMKKIMYISAILFIMAIGIPHAKAYSVSTMDSKYGIYCNYKNAEGENYSFSYTADDINQDFYMETDDFIKLGVAIESGRPGKTLEEDIEWLRKSGLVNDQSNFTCPKENPFGVTGLTLDELACNEHGCQTGIIPTSYESFSCKYKGQTSGSILKIDYTSSALYPNGQVHIEYPDGTTQVLTGTSIPSVLGHNITSSCAELYYVSSAKEIKLSTDTNHSNSTNPTLADLCKSYKINDIERFCAEGKSCSYEEMFCPTSTIGNKVDHGQLKGCDIKDIPEQLPIYISNIINLMKILVPILLVIMGMFDFARAVMSSDEKQMKEAQSRFIRRTLAAAIVFFVIAIVQFVFGAIGTDDNILGCVDCFINGDCKTTQQKKQECISEISKECGNNCYKKVGSNSSEAFLNCVNACQEQNNSACEK